MPAPYANMNATAPPRPGVRAGPTPRDSRGRQRSAAHLWGLSGRRAGVRAGGSMAQGGSCQPAARESQGSGAPPPEQSGTARRGGARVM